MSVPTLAAPWDATLSNAEHSLILYFLCFAALTLLAGFVRAYITRSEVGARYRASVVARLGLMGTASLGYVLIIIMFFVGYDPTSAGWVPNSYAINTVATRYMEWSVTVPLLCAELIAVTTALGVVARRTQFITMGGAFLMIFTGYLGAVVVDGGTNAGATAMFFGISVLFWVLTTVVLIRCVRASLPGLTPEAAVLLSRATVLLLAGWAIYPLVVSIQLFAAGGAWTTTIQVALCVTDVVVKVGFGTLIHRVAMLRTAEDVRAGDDIHPEAIWISSVKQSDAGLPREVYLAQSSTVHPTRTRPPDAAAVPTEPEPETAEARLVEAATEL